MMHPVPNPAYTPKGVTGPPTTMHRTHGTMFGRAGCVAKLTGKAWAWGGETPSMTLRHDEEEGVLGVTFRFEDAQDLHELITAAFGRVRSAMEKVGDSWVSSRGRLGEGVQTDAGAWFWRG